MTGSINFILILDCCCVVCCEEEEEGGILWNSIKWLERE